MRQSPISANRPLTVLQVLPEMRTGGVERGTAEIAAALVKAGHRALVASAGGYMETELAYAGAEHINLPLARKTPWAIYENAERLEKVIKREGVDIVHARSRAPAWSAQMAARRTKRHFVTTFHGVYGLDFPFKKHYNAIMTKGERVIAVSHFVREHILAHYPVDPEKVDVIHRGVNLERFSPERVKPMRAAQLAHEWRVPEDGHPIVMLTGRITRWKGHEVLIRALHALPHRNYHCLLVGDDVKHPDYAAELKKLVESLGLFGKVRMVGDTPHIAEAYMLSSVVVAPSIEPEAFGRVPIEAQAMGKPVIATRHGGAMETVREHETGWLVTPGSVTELAAALEEALSLDAETRAIIARNAIWNARENFSSERMCDATLELYRQVKESR